MAESCAGIQSADANRTAWEEATSIDRWELPRQTLFDTVARKMPQDQRSRKAWPGSQETGRS